MHSFEIRPSGSIWDPVDPGLEPDRVEEKNRKRKNSVWPGDPVDPARSGCNPLTFVFSFTKITSFWLKKRIDPGDPVKTRNRVLNRAESKNYNMMNVVEKRSWVEEWEKNNYVSWIRVINIYKYFYIFIKDLSYWGLNM